MTTTTGLTEGDVEVFISKLKQADNDKKVDLIQAFGLQLEDTSDLPVTTLDALTLTVSPLLKSTSHLLISAVLTSFVPFFVPFLPASPATHLQIALHQLLPLLLEKLNDPKERIQSAARTSVALLGKKSYEAEPVSVLGGSTIKGKEKEGPVGYWERNVKEAMAGKGWRGKVECMRMLLIMRAEEKSRLSLKPWLAPLVDLLKDGDGNVRDQARETVVALLSPAGTPPAAKQEVKKLLLAKGVRKTIADGILARILGSGTAVPATEVPLPADETPMAVGSRSGAATPAMDDVDVVLVASGRDLESELASMVPYFEGKETEHNWAPREKSMVRIRGLLRGQAYSKHPESLIAGLKGGIAEGLSKTLLSLRTTVAQQACALVQELPEYMGSGFDQFVESLLPVLGKMAGFTKKIIAEKSQRSLVAIITHSTCPPRMFIAHISAGINDKNVQTRNYSTSHLKLFLDVHGARSKHAIDSTPALLDTIEAGLRKSLADTNPAVRELGRAAYWSFQSVWPSRAQPIADNLDATARKQLDKADSKGTNGMAAAAAPARPAITKRPGASSSTAALLAQARKAKAAELAAGRAAQEVQRTVSSPIISSPTVQQRARATSSQVAHPVKTSISRLQTSPQSPQGSPTPLGVASPSPSHGSPAPRNIPKTQASSPQDLLSRSRSSSLVRTYSPSPPSSRGSPTISKSPLRQSDIPSGLHSPGESSSSTSGRLSVRTPNPPRARLSSGSATHGLGVFNTGTPPSANLIDLSSAPARRGSGSSDVDSALKAQAAQAESAAEQLLDLAIDEADSPVHAPITPARTAVNGKSTGSNGTSGANGTNGALHLFKTPANHSLAGTPSRRPWEDSPRPEAMTPQLFAQLKERKHERSWWLKRQELMDKATPLKALTPDPTSAVIPDVEALEHGLPTLRNLQKLALFAEEQGEGPAGARAWRHGKLFERVFEGLMGFLQPSKAIDLLEQGLVVLWEMVRNQWGLFEDHEDALVDALFRLRATPNIVIHESINSLMSFLVEVSEPVFFFSELRSSLGRYIASHPDTEPPQGAVYVGTKAREAGYIFGLTALGMCIMRIPPQVVRIEAPRLVPVISEAYGQREPQCRQAANLLVMAIQSVILDTQVTIGMLDLTDAQKNLVFYLFAKNDLMGDTSSGGEGAGEAVDGREKVMGEMDTLLRKAKSAVDL